MLNILCSQVSSAQHHLLQTLLLRSSAGLEGTDSSFQSSSAKPERVLLSKLNEFMCFENLNFFFFFFCHSLEQLSVNCISPVVFEMWVGMQVLSIHLKPPNWDVSLLAV